MPNEITIGIQPINWENQSANPHEIKEYIDRMDKEVEKIEKELEGQQGVNQNGLTALEAFRQLVNHRRYHLIFEIESLFNKGADFTAIENIIDKFIKDAYWSRNYLIDDYIKYQNNHREVNKKIADVSSAIQQSTHLDVLNFDNLDSLISNQAKQNTSKREQQQQSKSIRQQTTTPRFKAPQIRPKTAKVDNAYNICKAETIEDMKEIKENLAICINAGGIENIPRCLEQYSENLPPQHKEELKKEVDNIITGHAATVVAVPLAGVSLAFEAVGKALHVVAKGVKAIGDFYIQGAITESCTKTNPHNVTTCIAETKEELKKQVGIIGKEAASATGKGIKAAAGFYARGAITTSCMEMNAQDVSTCVAQTEEQLRVQLRAMKQNTIEFVLKMKEGIDSFDNDMTTHCYTHPGLMKEAASGVADLAFLAAGNGVIRLVKGPIKVPVKDTTLTSSTIESSIKNETSTSALASHIPPSRNLLSKKEYEHALYSSYKQQMPALKPPQGFPTNLSEYMQGECIFYTVKNMKGVAKTLLLKKFGDTLVYAHPNAAKNVKFSLEAVFEYARKDNASKVILGWDITQKALATTIEKKGLVVTGIGRLSRTSGNDLALIECQVPKLPAAPALPKKKPSSIACSEKTDVFVEKIPKKNATDLTLEKPIGELDPSNPRYQAIQGYNRYNNRVAKEKEFFAQLKEQFQALVPPLDFPKTLQQLGKNDYLVHPFVEEDITGTLFLKVFDEETLFYYHRKEAFGKLAIPHKLKELEKLEYCLKTVFDYARKNDLSRVILGWDIDRNILATVIEEKGIQIVSVGSLGRAVEKDLALIECLVPEIPLKISVQKKFPGMNLDLSNPRHQKLLKYYDRKQNEKKLISQLKEQYLPLTLYKFDRTDICEFKNGNITGKLPLDLYEGGVVHYFHKKRRFGNFGELLIPHQLSDFEKLKYSLDAVFDYARENKFSKVILEWDFDKTTLAVIIKEQGFQITGVESVQRGMRKKHALIECLVPEIPTKIAKPKKNPSSMACSAKADVFVEKISKENAVDHSKAFMNLDPSNQYHEYLMEYYSKKQTERNLFNQLKEQYPPLIPPKDFPETLHQYTRSDYLSLPITNKKVKGTLLLKVFDEDVLFYVYRKYAFGEKSILSNMKGSKKLKYSLKAVFDYAQEKKYSKVILGWDLDRTILANLIKEQEIQITGIGSLKTFEKDLALIECLVPKIPTEISKPKKKSSSMACSAKADVFVEKISKKTGLSILGVEKLPLEKSFWIDKFYELGYEKIKGAGKGSHMVMHVPAKLDYPIVTIPGGKELTNGVAGSLKRTYMTALEITNEKTKIQANSLIEKTAIEDIFGYEKPFSHRLDYTKQYLEAKKDFAEAKEFNGILQRNLVVVRFQNHDSNYKWFMPVHEANQHCTLEGIKDAAAKLNKFGEVTEVVVARIPAGEQVRFLHGRAKEKIDVLNNEIRCGGAVQYRFFDFDEKWIVAKGEL